MDITRRFKNYFLKGMAVLLPTFLSIWILVWGYNFIQHNVTKYINQGLINVMLAVEEHGLIKERLPEPKKLTKAEIKVIKKEIKDQLAVKRKELNKKFVNGLAGSIVGFIIALIIILIIGALLASVVGRALWKVIEEFIMNTPVFNRVYPYVKQITDFLLTQQEQEQLFSRVVAVEYPRKGVWSIGMVTGSGLRKVNEKVEKEFLTILIPNSPTPLTGYVVMVQKEQTIALDLTIEEAFRFIVSAGLVVPNSQKMKLQTPKAAKSLPEKGVSEK